MSDAAESSQAASSSTADHANEAQPRVCAQCSNPEVDLEEKPLKACSKCHTTLYCNRDCQKAGFKSHKTVCAKLAQTYAETTEPKIAPTRRPPKEGHRGKIGKWEYDT